MVLWLRFIITGFTVDIWLAHTRTYGRLRHQWASRANCSLFALQRVFNTSIFCFFFSIFRTDIDNDSHELTHSSFLIVSVRLLDGHVWFNHIGAFVFRVVGQSWEISSILDHYNSMSTDNAQEIWIKRASSFLLLLIGSNSVRLYLACTVVEQVIAIISFLRYHHPHLSRPHAIAVILCPQCFKRPSLFPTTSSLNANI